VHLLVDRIVGIGRREIVEVAVEVDVVLVGPLEVREAERIDRMDQQQRDAAIGSARRQLVVQQGELAGRAGEPLGAMRAGADDEQPGRVGRTQQRDISADLLSRRALQRMDVMLDGGACRGCGFQEALPGLAVGGGEESGAHLTFSSIKSRVRKAPPITGRNQGLPE
jgi:hypothetical protein